VRGALPAVLLTCLALVAALTAPLTLGSSAPASAGAAVSSVVGPSVPTASAGPAATPGVNTCPTPQNLPNWNGAGFFNDTLVSFTVPGYSNLSGSHFGTVPCTNQLPEYLIGFWMNVTTDVPLTQAYVTIWGTGYPSQNDPYPPLAGFDPTSPVVRPMAINGTFTDTASFFFDTARFFYPGTTIDFNITLDSANATPSTINSAAEGISQISPSNSADNATWKFSLGTPWWSDLFTDDIAISTTPSVLGGQQYAPNINQTFSVGLESKGPTGLPGVPIPYAIMNFVLTGSLSGAYGDIFGPENHTWQNLTVPLGPYPNETVKFNITAWLPWEGGAIDEIASPNYEFVWSSGGGWRLPALGLSSNANLTTEPFVLANTTTTVLSTGTPVNVSVTEALPNVTIDSSIVRFHYSDPAGDSTGVLPMSLITQNRTYTILPGLPAGGVLTFSVEAKDVFQDPVASNSYTYTETGPSSFAPANATYFFVEAVDVTTGSLVAGAHYTVANSTWSDSALTNPMGFSALQIPNGAGYLALPYASYTVTMTAFGHTQSTRVTLTQGVPLVVHFWFASGAVPGSASVNTIPITVGLVAGLLVATVAFVPLFSWFKERQARAEEERRRVTL
jgi:hypothetical protein